MERFLVPEPSEFFDRQEVIPDGHGRVKPCTKPTHMSFLILNPYGSEDHSNYSNPRLLSQRRQYADKCPPPLLRRLKGLPKAHPPFATQGRFSPDIFCPLDRGLKTHNLKHHGRVRGCP